MKAMTRHLVVLSLLAVGCGASNEDDGDDTSPGTALACDAVGWCTSWDSDKRPVTDAPALKGGAIPDGLYRLERGSEDARAMLIKGRSVLKVNSLYFNILGTWKVEGSRMVITTTSTCNQTDEEPFKETFRYAFAFKGDTLYLHEDEFEDMPIEAWRKVDQLCEENASFNCKVSNCACSYVSNSSFKDKEMCF
ncbi:hypothetical protein SAMN05443572_102127 [Myxococcus fulvus]|uniref:Lipoprotein n=1 Tax=Myxococcus fulvus TaxID=33 RepID=A0A511TCY9_MYXFU|nr:hypothetical protein [Myxococcus fulvus]GEN11008.1 hypothetical protein MFU01_60450 [Myxococcus fulvus]SET39464.1 hypothetical protein SAMN05443572_102127 [Myxococcus fulvus]